MKNLMVKMLVSFLYIRNLILKVLIFLIMLIGIARADWLDSWFDQYIATTPNYFEGQKRGHITFGSFSARTGAGGSLPLLTIEFPRVRGGCGGIDLFLGGFSFVNPEYLVQKLQNLIQAAPAVAFNLALKVLSASLADEVKWVENVINLLNQLQFDECKFLQPLMIEEVKGSTVSERLQYVKQQVEEGYRNLYHEIKKNVERESFDRGKKDEIIKDCPSVVRDVYRYGSLLEWVGSGLGVSSFIVDSVRAFTGDVVVSTQADSPTFVYIRPIVTAADLKGHIEQYKLVRMNRSGQKIEQDVNFLNNIRSVLDRAYAAKVNKLSAPSEYIKYAKISPIPLEIVMNIAYISRKPDFYAGMLPAIALGIYKEFMYSVISEGQSILSRIPDVPGDPNCASMVATLRDALKEMDQKLFDYYALFNEVYAQRLNEVEKSFNVALNLYSYQSEVRRKLAERLGLTPTAILSLGL